MQSKGNKSVTLRLLSYFKPYRLKLCMLAFFCILELACVVVAPYLIGYAIDRCFIVTKTGIDVFWEVLVVILMILLVVYVCNAIFSFFVEYGMTVVTQRVVHKIRSDLFDSLLRQNVSVFDKNGAGDLMSRFTNDVELIRQSFGSSVVQMFGMVVQFVAMLAVMFSLCWQLTLAVCAVVPFVLFLGRMVMKKTRKYFSAQQTEVGELNRFIEESVSLVKLTKSLGAEKKRNEVFDMLNARLINAGVKAQVFSGILIPLLRFVDNLVYVMVAAAGGLLAYKAIITIGVIQTFLLYTRHFLRPLNRAASQINEIQAAIAGAVRIFEAMDGLCEENSGLVKEMKDAEVVFDNVSFGYEKDKNIICGLSFSAKPNEVVAIVGPTGAGKTTLANLLMRFYDVQGGSVRIGGVDVRNIDMSCLRRFVGLVPQTPFIFSETLKYNVYYGCENADEKKFQDVLKYSNVANFSDRLDGGVYAVLNRQGETLSAGQKQMITIARSMMKEAQVLVFDEATSSIDTYTEFLVQEAIQKLRAGKTCIVIAHRLNTVKNADRILVLSEGRIVEQGGHKELLSVGGVYASMYKNQFFS